MFLLQMKVSFGAIKRPIFRGVGFRECMCICVWDMFQQILKNNTDIQWAMTHEPSAIYVIYSIYTPRAQMTFVLIGKDLALEGSNRKIEDISRFQV